MFFVKKNNEKRLKPESGNINSQPTAITAPVYCEELTDEEVKQSIRRLHDTMQEYRNRRAQDRIDAQKAAQEFISD